MDQINRARARRLSGRLNSEYGQWLHSLYGTTLQRRMITHKYIMHIHMHIILRTSSTNACCCRCFLLWHYRGTQTLRGKTHVLPFCLVELMPSGRFHTDAGCLRLVRISSFLMLKIVKHAGFQIRLPCASAFTTPIAGAECMQ